MLDQFIGMYLYRIVNWDDYPRQEKEFNIIKIPYDFSNTDDWEEVAGFDTLKEAIDFIEGLK